MSKWYFTFGSDEGYPFGREDYVLVCGKDLHDAMEKYKAVFPNRAGEDLLNCADFYSEYEWNSGVSEYYVGVEPVRVIE